MLPRLIVEHVGSVLLPRCLDLMEHVGSMLPRFICTQAKSKAYISPQINVAFGERTGLIDR